MNKLEKKTVDFLLKSLLTNKSTTIEFQFEFVAYKRDHEPFTKWIQIGFNLLGDQEKQNLRKAQTILLSAQCIPMNRLAKRRLAFCRSKIDLECY